jgi:hypothetical protein
VHTFYDFVRNMHRLSEERAYFEGKLEIYVQRALLAGIVCGREAGKANCTKIVSDTK